MPQMLVTSDSLRDDEVRSLAKARAIILHSFGGRVRFLAEMITGESVASEEGPGIPRNPQGLYGIDKSGYPFGPAWRHGIAGRGGMKPDGASWAGHETVGTVKQDVPLVDPVVVQNRHYALVDGAPYSRGYVVVRAYKAGAGGGGDRALVVSLRSRDGIVMSEQIDVTSTSDTAYALETAHFALDPGLNDNRLQIEFLCSHADGVVVVAWFINQVEKRRHT